MKAVRNKSEESFMKKTKISVRLLAGIMVALMFFSVLAGVLVYLLA